MAAALYGGGAVFERGPAFPGCINSFNDMYNGALCGPIDLNQQRQGWNPDVFNNVPEPIGPRMPKMDVTQGCWAGC
jgi:hypothetical protein